VLGRIGVEGMTREELGAYIKKALLDRKLLEDNPLVVTVEFANLNVAVLGEVGRPGRYAVDKDRLTLLDVLGMAGDLTIYGNRNDVAVIREREGKSIVTKLDLRSGDIFSSPCFYLEQNDVVRVSPNKYRAATSEINQNRSFWISLASTTISLATLILTIVR
jgi:polysaccharide export outer membrane protein